MPKWLSAAIATALWPALMMFSVVALSPPVLELYNGGALGDSPVVAFAFISSGAFAISVLVCVAVWALLRATVGRPHEDRHRQPQL